jgi:pre-rRNA-processing protein TSR4
MKSPYNFPRFISVKEKISMWKGGSDVNNTGDYVRIYVPIAYKFTGQHAPTSSYIGGTPSYFNSDIHVNRGHPICKLCSESMPLLVQLHVPLPPNSIPKASNDRSFYLFVCNRSSCCQAALEQEGGNVSLGGGGIVLCRRSHGVTKNPSPATQSDMQVAKSTWDETYQSAEEEEENDWEVDDVRTCNNNDMEIMLQQMEDDGPRGTGEKKKKPKKKISIELENSDVDLPQFPCYEIRCQKEPYGGHNLRDRTNDDHVGIAASSDEKIQAMLARYMEEEDDEDILTAIRGSVSGVNGTELEEQLSDSDRILLEFTDRIKRLPRQVLRYAKDGIPMWSVPLLAKEQQLMKKCDNGTGASNVQVPNCACGAKRIFEFQIMPSILHFLEVDKHALGRQYKTSVPPGEEESKDCDVTWTREFSEGGQNWGVIAVYTCSAACDMDREDFVVLQRSLDSVPIQREHGSMVVQVYEGDMEGDDDEDDSKA